MIAVSERIGGKRNADWPGFKAANADLFVRKPSLIQEYYSNAQLMSENARRVFVLPYLAA